MAKKLSNVKPVKSLCETTKQEGVRKYDAAVAEFARYKGLKEANKKNRKVGDN